MILKLLYIYIIYSGLVIGKKNVNNLKILSNFHRSLLLIFLFFILSINKYIQPDL